MFMSFGENLSVLMEGEPCVWLAAQQKGRQQTETQALF